MSDEQDEWPRAILELREGLDRAFDALEARCSTPAERLDRRPEDGGWTPREILEHVALTDQFLLILIDKIADRSQRRLEAGETWPVHGPRFEVLQHLASRTQAWDSPGHMVPTGLVEMEEIARRLRDDRQRCARHLAEFPRGEGTLYRIRMSAVGGDDDRLDLYQYLEVVRLHADRHLAQLERALD